MKIIFVRQEDYWIFPLSFFGVFFTGTFFYAGSGPLKWACGLAGFSTLYFGTYIIRKNYSRRLSARYLFICLLTAILGAIGFYYLTR